MTLSSKQRYIEWTHQERIFWHKEGEMYEVSNSALKQKPMNSMCYWIPWWAHSSALIRHWAGRTFATTAYPTLEFFSWPWFHHEWNSINQSVIHADFWLLLHWGWILIAFGCERTLIPFILLKSLDGEREKIKQLLALQGITEKQN